MAMTLARAEAVLESWYAAEEAFATNAGITEYAITTISGTSQTVKRDPELIATKIEYWESKVAALKADTAGVNRTARKAAVVRFV